MNTTRNRFTKIVSFLMAIVVGLTAGYGLSGSSNTVFAATTDTTSSSAASTSSAAPKCTGSITIDTRSYTMAPGNIYDVGIKLVGAQGKVVRVYSSRTSIATESKLANGNYRIKAVSTGVTYVIVEVYNTKGKLLNHASVKVTVQKGAHQGGVATRAVSLLYDDDTDQPAQSTIPANGSAGNDPVANATWIVDNLGFYQGTSTGAYYNPVNNKVVSAYIQVVHTDKNYLTFTAWDGNPDSQGSYTIKSKGQQLFKFYLPNSYMRLYNMIEAFDNGSDADIGKHFNLDGRDVVFGWNQSSGQLKIIIGNK